MYDPTPIRALSLGWFALLMSLGACGAPEALDFPLDTLGEQQAPLGCGRLLPGESLPRGQAIYSCNGAVTLSHQADGNVVAYDSQGALWFTGTNGQPTTSLAMQGDGNLVLYNGGVAVWNSQTFGQTGAYLSIQDDCNLVLYRNNTAVWSTNRTCRVTPPASPGVGMPSIPNNAFAATVTVNGVGARTAPRALWGMNLVGSVARTKADFYARFGATADAGRTTLTGMGIKQIRFPGGCHGDGYDWRANKMYFSDYGGGDVAWDVMPVPDFLAIASELGAEPIFQLNVETRGYRNACGWISRYPQPTTYPTEAQRLARLLDDAQELLRRHGNVLRTFELGNEPWGSSVPSDPNNRWKPDEYANVALAFARALKAIDPNVRMLLVGHPTTGNNMTGETNVPADVAWTAMVKRLLADRSCQGGACFSGVTDHAYSYAGYSPLANNYANVFKGMGAFWPEAVMPTLFSKRTADYAGAGLALTEWNMKCWPNGRMNQVSPPVQVLNGSFESGTASWGFWQQQPNTGTWNTVTTQPQHGTTALRIALTAHSGAASDIVQTQQLTAVPPGKRVTVTAYVKMARPLYGSIILQQSNAGAHQWHHIAEGGLASIKAGEWQGVTLTGTTFADTTQLQVVFRLRKYAQHWPTDPSPVDMLVDNVQFYESTAWSPPVAAVSTVEHGMMVADSYFRMARGGVSSSNYHAFDPGDCGISTGAGAAAKLNPQGDAFRHTSVLAGGTFLPASVNAPAANWVLPASPGCTGYGCLPGGKAVNFLTAHAGRSADGGSLYVFLINRHHTATANASVRFQDLNVATLLRKSTVTLRATDYTQRAFTHVPAAGQPVPIEVLGSNNPFTVAVPPLSVVRVRLQP
ncbi:carbohydrate binding domain-containing protein [Myxococcus sp. 1LA]